MNSIAIWFERNNNSLPHNGEADLDIHINHWKIKLNKSLYDKSKIWFSKNIFRKQERSSQYDYFMDMGLKVGDTNQLIHKIFIYIPHELQNKIEIIEDIGSKLNDPKLLKAVFNEDYSLETKGSKEFLVKNANDNLFYIYGLDVQNDINIIKQFNGTTISFDHKINDTNITYYRFRLKSIFVERLSEKLNPKNSFLESAFSTIELIDFKINDKRNLNLSLIEYVRPKGRFKINLIHYFIMRNIKDEYIVSNQETNSVRPLEKDTWEAYLGNKSYVKDRYMAYHIKRKAESNNSIIDFSVFFKFRYEDNKLPIYIFYLLAFGLLTEVWGNKLNSFLDNNWNQWIMYLKNIFK
jgi:hypothetical protein